MSYKRFKKRILIKLKSKIEKIDWAYINEEIYITIVTLDEAWYNFWWIGPRIHHRNYQRYIRGRKSKLEEAWDEVNSRRNKRKKLKL